MRPKTWTIKELLKVTSTFLKEKEIESPRLTSELLLSHQLNLDRVGLYLNFDRPVIETELSGYRSLIKRRLLREPVQYIRGLQEFWSLDLMVDRRVLIPRPETELLVELAIEKLRTFASEGRPNLVLDMATGCGAVAISLAKELQDTQIWATDISGSALELAHDNAKRHGVLERIQFSEGDLWDPLRDQGITFDIILSNPPYICSEEFDGLPPEVRNYEPRLALDGGEGGMYYIERIIRGALDYMNPGGWIMLEMAPDQTAKALGIIDQIEEYAESSRIKDYGGHYRAVMAQKGVPGEG